MRQRLVVKVPRAVLKSQTRFDGSVRPLEVAAWLIQLLKSRLVVRAQLETALGNTIPVFLAPQIRKELDRGGAESQQLLRVCNIAQSGSL